MASISIGTHFVFGEKKMPPSNWLHFPAREREPDQTTNRGQRWQQRAGGVVGLFFIPIEADFTELASLRLFPSRMRHAMAMHTALPFYDVLLLLLSSLFLPLARRRWLAACTFRQRSPRAVASTHERRLAIGVSAWFGGRGWLKGSS